MERSKEGAVLKAEVVASDSDEGWVVVIGSRKSAPVHRVREAVQQARREIQGRGGGVVTVHSRSGRIVEQQTVPKGRDRVYS
jgi:hypothetical protein